MRKLASALISMSLVAFSGAALAGDAEAGKAKGDACLDCHEPAEDFAGQSAADIEARIRELQAGGMVGGKKHSAEINDLAEEDIADVAAWFAHEAAE
jgi:cytochrome c553